MLIYGDACGIMKCIQYTCTDEILAGLGKMYIADERFKKNIDKYGEGTAEFAAGAIAMYCQK